MSNEITTIQQVYENYGLTNEDELYQYMVETFFNGNKKQASDIIKQVRLVSNMRDNYIETFATRIDEWFDAETSEILKTFFNIQRND